MFSYLSPIPKGDGFEYLLGYWMFRKVNDVRVWDKSALAWAEIVNTLLTLVKSRLLLRELKDDNILRLTLTTTDASCRAGIEDSLVLMQSQCLMDVGTGVPLTKIIPVTATDVTYCQ